MAKDKMKTNPYGIENRKVKIEKIMSRKEKAAKDKKYGIGLYAEPKKLKGGGSEKINDIVFNLFSKDKIEYLPLSSIFINDISHNPGRAREF